MIVCKLSDILNERSMSRRALARKAGVNKNTICKWIHGQVAMIDVPTLDAICQALRVQPGEVFRREADTDA
jgi:DNA-binding Xre family transcriptional regulator